MYEGINVQNGGITVDLDSLQKTENGELILDGISSLKVFVENGASYDQTKLEILENNNDVRVSFTDANGNEIFMILKGLAQILLTNQTDNPVFEVFEGPTQLATMTTIDDLEAAAAGGAPAGSDQTANPAGAGDLDGTDSGDSGARLNGLPGAGPFDPTAAIIGNFAPVVFDVSLEDIEVLGEEGAGDKNIITGALTVFDEDEEDIGLHTFTPIEGSLVVTSFNEDGTENGVITVEDDDILVVLNPDGTFEISGDFNNLGLGEYATVSFDYFATDIEGATSNVATVTLTIEGTNDIPVVTDVNLNGSAEDQVVQDFEDGLIQDDNSYIIYDNNLRVLDTSTYQASGYVNGIISGDNVAYNANGVSPISFSFTEVVTFESTYMTSSWYTTQDVVFEGYLNGQLIYTSDSIEINYNGPTLIELNWDNIDQLIVYNTPTGIDVQEDNGSGSHWAMDDFTYSLGSGKKVVYETIDADSQDTNGNGILRDDEVNNLFEGTLTVSDDDDNDTHEFFMASLEEGNYNIGTEEEPMLVNLELGNLADDSTLSIDDIDLDLTINTDGTYSLGGNFTSLAVGETATVTIEYYAVDDSGAGLGDANNEPEESEHKTITFTITGTNDQPVVENLDLNGGNSGISDIPNQDDSPVQGVSSGLVGYYDMAEGSGTVIQEEILSLGGFSSKDLDDLTAQDIENLNALYIDKYSSTSEFTNNLASIHSSVYNGMTLIINDGSPSEANSILPGLTQTLVSSSYSNADVNIGPDGVELSNGTLGNLDDSSLDGGSSSIHGAFESSSLPDGAKILLTSGNANEVVAFSYEYGSGTVIYSTMPLMAYFDPDWLYNNPNYQDFIAAAKIYINNTVEDELANDIVYETNDTDSTDTNGNEILRDDEVNNLFEGTLTVSDDDVNDTHEFYIAKDGITVVDSPVDSENNEIITLDDLDITINPDGTYSIGGDFTELAVGETVTVNVEYYAVDNQGKDGTDGINETSESEHKIITFTITGTNDQPVVENINLNNLDDLQSTGSDIGHIPFEGTPNGFTISFTLNLDSAVTQNTPIIYQGEGFPPNSGYIAAPYIAISNHPVYNQSLLFQMGDSYEHFYSDFSFSPGIDYDIQMVFENGTVNLYVDGNLISHAYDSGDANFDSVPTNNETMFINDVGMTVSNLVILNANGNQINVIDNSSVLYETLDTDSTDTNQNGVLLDEDGNNIFTGTLTVSDDDVNDTHEFYIAKDGITVVDSPVDSENNEIITLDDLDITINPDGTYSIGGDFTELAAGETVTVNVEYYAVDNQGKDGTDGINETSESEHKTLSFTITGTNDQPVVDEVTIDVLESELASNPDNQTLTISTDSQYALGNYVSDDDVNDTHTFARAEGSTISLSINTTNATLLTAIANQDLAYIKSVLAEIVAIPEVTTALTNGIDAIPAIDVQSTIAAFMAAPDIATALAIVNSTFGTVGVTAQLDPVTGLTLSIDDASALEAESLLNVTVNQDGSYEVTSPLFDHLSVDDRVSVSFDYVANDGTNDANGETNVSEANTVTLNIQGSNDQPVVDEVTIDVLESELASNPDNQTLTISTDSQYALGNYVSDDDVNDTHTFARAEGSTISLSINTTNATLLTAIANQDLAYIKSVLAEIVAIPEVTTALTNGIDAIPAIDVQSTIAAFMAAPDIATALAIVNSTFGTVGVTAQLDPVTGLTLSIDDASALEAESLLNVTVNQDGSYEVTSPLFDHLSVDDRVSVSFDYVANDGTNDANGETNVSEANTVTLNIQGTNDQPVIQSISKIDGIYELNDLITEFPWEEYYYVLSQEDLFANTIISDDDVNDTHTLQLASASILFDGGIYSNNFQYTFDQNSASGPNNPISNPVNSGILEVTQDFLDNYPQVNANVGDFIIYNSEFNHLSAGEKVLVTFDVVANDGTNDANGETNLSAPKTVTVEVVGTNDQPVVENITLGNTQATIIYEETLLDVGTSEDVVFKGKVAQAIDEDINNTNPHYLLVGNIQVEQNPISLTASDIEVVLKDAAPGGWSTTRDYEVSSDKFNTLAEGETVTLSFNYKASDWEGFGTTGDANNEPSHSEVKTVTITITGTNDTPVAKSFIHDGPANNGQVWENAGQQIVIDPTSDFGVDDLSSIAGYDVDVNDTLRVNSISNDAGDTVTYDGVNATAWIESNSGVAVRINADGKVEYNLNMFKTNGETVFDHLDAGDTTTDTFNFTLIDDNGAVSNTAVATINILGTNDKPIINSNLVANLTEINEDVLDADNTGTLVSALLGNSVNDFDDDAVEGIAVTGIDNTNGTWQYSIDGGTSWNNFDNGTSDTNATMLYDSSLVRFVPNEDYYGTADITYHAWDQNGYNLVNGSTAVDITSSYGGIKGTVSTDSATSSVTVDSVQDFIANTQGNPLVDTSKDNKAKVYEVGIDDANDNSETDTKAFRIEFGDDTPGTITFNATQTVPNGLTSGGEAIVYDVSADGLTITAKTQTTDEVVFTLEIDNTTPQTVGSYTNTNSYTMTLFKPIDHLMNQHNGETKYLSFDYDSEDSDGDVRSGKVTLQVVDDVPTAGWSGYTDNNGQTGYVVTETTDANGFVTLSTSGASLNFDGGADGATVTELRFANEVGDKIQTKYVSNNERYFLQSQGEDIVLERTGLDITGKANGVTVFTIVVDEVTGDYTYTQYAPIDHVEGSTSGSYQDEIVNLVLQYTVTDGDGDTATGYSTVRVEDDSPISLSQNGIAQNAVVEESNVGDSTTASLRVDYGADGFASVAFTGEVQGYMHDQLTSGGVPITYDFSIPGKVIAKAGAETVFEVILNADGKTYDVNLIGSLDHTAPDGQAGGRDEGQSINFVFEATDKDGDTLESSLSVRIIDDEPIASWTAPVLVDEASLNTVVNGQLNFDGGADGAEVTSVFHHWQNANDGTVKIYDGPNGTAFTLTSGGEAVVVTYEDNGMTMIGKLSDDTEVFRLEAQSDGSFTFVQKEAIDHPIGSTQEDDLLLKLKFTVTDADGDTSTSNFGVKITDDTPVADYGGRKDISEADIDSSVPASVTGQLTFDGGEDGATLTDVNFWGEGSQVMVYDGQGNPPIALTSNGEPVIATQMVDVNGVITITAVANTTPVYTLVVQPDGNYEFTLEGPIDHPQSSLTGQDEELLLRYSYTVTDGDGDTDVDYFSINIIDDVPTIDGMSSASTTEADANNDGIFDEAVVTGTLGRINEGADGAIVTEMHISNTADYNNLTSGGDAVTATQVGNVITGAKSDGTVVFTFTYDENGNYTFTQKEPLDHNGRSETLIKLGFGYTITDADGDTASSALIVSIHDDEPIVVADTNSVSEAASGITTKSQISGNILTNDKDVDVDNDDAIEIIGLEMTSPQAISSTVATHTINGQLYEGFHITGVYGNIMVDAKSGEYIYNLYNDRDIVNELSEGEQVNETFSYTITDENGVTQVSTLTINITGTNDAPVLSYNSIEDLINENISGKLLGTLDVEDVDSNINSAGFTITGDDASLVEIRENAGQFELWLKDSAVVDFETNNSLDITVAYADDYSASDSESISIGITDVELGVVENTQNISLITEENIGTIHGYETTSDSPVEAATDTDDSSITKTYQLDPSLAGQFVSISFDTTTYGDGGWEEATATNWADWVTVDDGNTVQQIDADSNATETHNINVKVGAGGVLTLVFDANITGSDSGPRQESVDINNLNINTFVADIALNGVETLSDTNTYSFSHNLGIAYAGETVRVYFDTNTYGSGQWDEASENNTGGYSDYIEVSDGFTSQEIYPADGMNTYYVDAIVDSTGSVNLEFDARITGVNEHLDIDITSIDVTDKTIDFGSDDLEIDMAQLLSSAEDFNPDGSQTSIDEIDLSSGDHILSNISVGDVLAMTDSDNTLKIETDSGDTVKLDLTNEWTATGNIDVDTGLDIYEGVTDSSVKLLIDSLNVEDTNI
ncbi:DUF5801 repeats-in-toxin domain-containing protein [Arcobacter arenosus]|uniref:DUF5801 domain-containing protein n=1 Tax=Arcobacter arenosus TaxID=2576037 RepID=A0A5R8XYY2_9BACT|nr:DUF5801 repeats-in-toxin domain-containing protein [Arcobacter arenosus]TLP36807.1 hypothetical protein FDK22_11180 [Arcobacter arenosus]